MEDTLAIFAFTFALLIAGAWMLAFLGALCADAFDAILGAKDKPQFVARRKAR